MKNPITELFENIPEQEMRQAIKEIQTDYDSGFICDGVVRKYAKEVKKITGEDNTMDLTFSEINILRQAAYRWSDLCNTVDKFYTDVKEVLNRSHE